MMRKYHKDIIQLFISLILIFVFLNIFIGLFNFKPYRLKRDIIDEYYNVESLKEILKEELGEDYTDNIDEDFNLFVNKLFNSKITSVN